MKTKVNKIVKLAAAGLFLVALSINVKVTLDDPFVMLSEQAIATGSGTGTECTGTSAPAGMGFYVDYWHSGSTQEVWKYKIKPSSPIITQMTSVNGDFTIGANTVSAGGSVCSNTTYNVSIIMYECGFENNSYDAYCKLKNERTTYSW